VNENTPSISVMEALQRLDVMANKVMAEMRMILTLGDCQASMLKLKELRLEISTHGLTRLYAIPELRGEYPSLPIAETDVSGWLFSAPKTF
jgi:hypothetical protein